MRQTLGFWEGRVLPSLSPSLPSPSSTALWWVGSFARMKEEKVTEKMEGDENVRQPCRPRRAPRRGAPTRHKLATEEETEVSSRGRYVSPVLYLVSRD